MMILKTRIIPTSTAVIAALTGAATAATVVFDDYSSGSFSIGAGGPSGDTSSILTPFAKSRIARGSGPNNWSSSVDDVGGVFSYSLGIPNAIINANQWIQLTYLSSPGNWNLVGYDSFVIHVDSVNGRGQIMAFDSPFDPQPGVIPVSLTDAGDVLIPFGNMAQGNPNEPRALSLRIIPEDPDFSVSIGGISVVPEPSAAMFAGLGVVLWAAGRSRRRNG